MPFPPPPHSSPAHRPFCTPDIAASPVMEHLEEEEDRRDLFDGGEQHSGVSLAQNPKAVNKLFRAVRKDNQQSLRGASSTAQDVAVSSGGVFRPFWVVLFALGFLLLLFCFIGMIVTLVYLVPNSQSRGISPSSSQEQQLAPLPLLWAMPMEGFSDISTILIRTSPTNEELHKFNAVQRNSERNITRLVLAANYQLILSADVGVLLQSSSGGGSDGSVVVAARWNFNKLWKEMYEERYGQPLLQSEDRFDQLVAEVVQPFNSLLSPSSALSSSELSPPPLPPTSAMLVDSPLPATSSSSMLVDLSSPTTTTTASTPMSFPLLLRRPPVLPAGSVALPASVVTPEEEAFLFGGRTPATEEALEVLQGFPEPPVDEDEPIQFAPPPPSPADVDQQPPIGSSLLVGGGDAEVAREDAGGGEEEGGIPSDGIMEVEEEEEPELSSSSRWDGARSRRDRSLVVDDLLQLKLDFVTGKLLEPSAARLGQLASLGGALLASPDSTPNRSLFYPLVYYGGSDSFYWLKR
eukprot:GHVS01036468.1.p1 GENE.GHVS01036468.1~~GHVS01036468.1.p1  ORF type:complete len:521 (-),score=158.38 GHVS01036468.1:199-1761(-)